MFWHSLIATQIVWIRVCFLCRGNGKVEQEQHLAPVTESLQTWLSYIFSSLFFFWSPLFFLLFHKRRFASAPQIAVMFWVMISSLLWLSCPAARQSGMGKRNKIKHLKNNTQVVGERSRTTGHTSQRWREDKADRQQQKRCCLAVFATYFLLVCFSLLLFAPTRVRGGDLKLNS